MERNYHWFNNNVDELRSWLPVNVDDSNDVSSLLGRRATAKPPAASQRGDTVIDIGGLCGALCAIAESDENESKKLGQSTDDDDDKPRTKADSIQKLLWISGVLGTPTLSVHRQIL